MYDASNRFPSDKTHGSLTVGQSISGLIDFTPNKRVFDVVIDPTVDSWMAPTRNVVVVASSFSEAAELAVEHANVLFEMERRRRAKRGENPDDPEQRLGLESIVSMEVVRRGVAVRRQANLAPTPAEILAAQQQAAKAVVAEFPIPSPDEMDAEMRELDLKVHKSDKGR